jgi:DNA-binding transcriptional ArsR family regulator
MTTERTQHVGSALERAVVVLRAMAYEHRLHILVLLQTGEHTPTALAASMVTDPTAIAHHLRFLKDARLIRWQRRGRKVYYALHGQATGQLVRDVLRFAEDAG